MVLESYLNKCYNYTKYSSFKEFDENACLHYTWPIRLR